MRDRLGALALLFLANAAGAAPLTFLGAIPDASDLALGLGGASAIAASPDGRFVYVAGFGEDAVDVFSRDPASGALTFVEAERDGIAGVDGIDGAAGIALSPDGAFLYATGLLDSAIAVFERDPLDGSLTFLEQQKNGVAGVTGLTVPGIPAVSADGAHVYVPGGLSVVVFARQPGGGLDFVEAADAGGLFDSVGSVVVSRDGKNVYASSFNPGNARIVVFARDAVTGHLTFLEAEADDAGGVDGIAGVAKMLLSSDQRHLYATAVNDDSLAHFERDPATGLLDFVTFLDQGVAGVDGLLDANGIAMDRRGTRLFTMGSAPEIGVFTRDTVTGSVAFSAVVSAGDPIGGAIAVAGDHAYTAGFDAVATLSIAELVFREFQQDGVAGANGLQNPEAIAATPDGGHLLVGSFADDALTCFAVDPATGALDVADSATNGVGGVTNLDGVYGVAVSPDGKHVYTTSINGSGGIALFTVNAATGALGFVGAQPNSGTSARSPAVSPDGKHVYVPYLGSDSVVTYSRNAGTGALAFVESDVDGAGGVDGLDGANAVALSHDGASVYVASEVEGAVAAFSRNPTTGALSFVGAAFDGLNGVDGLSGAGAIAVAPDDRFVYAIGRSDSAVAIFSRNPATGALSYVERVADGIGGIDLLGGAYSLAFGPGGATLIVSAQTDDAITVFRRDRDTGRLFLAQTEQNGVDGITSLGGARPVAVIDGLATYVGGIDTETVTVFAPEPDALALAIAAFAVLAARSRRRG